ncbi:hypothetical protein ACO1O0_001793 [Amphichorda felina]
MARDTKDVDSASSTSGQSKRPPLNRQESDSQSESHLRYKQHQKQHHVGRLHGRVPSSKGLHKQHAHAHPHQHSQHSQHNNHSRRPESPPPDHAHHHNHHQPKRPSSHRRATSEVKLQRELSSTNLHKNISQSSLKRNRSHGDVHKRSKSSEKLKRNSAGSGGSAVHHRPKSSKSQVHFDLGSDGPDDEGEWVDASGSNSPYMSRKGSINSSAQSSLRPAMSVNNSRPETPNDPPPPQDMSTPDRERNHHQRYLTTRLLQRTPSHGAPPQMTTEIAQVNPPMLSPGSVGQETTSSTLPGSNRDGLTSRFVDTPGSGVTSEGSFLPPLADEPRRSEDLPRRPNPLSGLSRSNEETHSPRLVEDKDDSALVPKPARRTTGQPAETSRIQQKLNLQRASSAIEPGHTGPVGGGITTPLIGVGGPGYDGGASRDPRVGKLLERTGMEYLVVRRYQNPIARSLNRLSRATDMNKKKRIPRVNTGSVSSRRSLDPSLRHARNVSMPDPRRPVTPRNAASIRTVTGSSFEGDDESRLNERLSGSSLVGSSDDDGTSALLRNLWEKSTDLCASGD